ncbi:unnamed protein product [Anisakis simplex]|uniref:RING-type domain-containing protein n=1 Tax=Anisakis simplex TaxID=6269 RepID=A0A0M3JVQ4_ANISI|nr:unnamed protein product [Anisakis simplex]
MEADSGGSVVKTRRQVRRIKQSTNNSSNLEKNELQQSKGSRKRVISKDGGHSETGSVPLAQPSRSVLSQRSLSSARCRIYDWKARRFTKPEQLPPAVVQKVDQNVTLKCEPKSFSWNLSLEERRKRDSKSVLPTAKNTALSKTTRRRLKRNGRSVLQDKSIESIENLNQDGGIEDYSSSMTLGPSTSQITPEHSDVCDKWKCNARKRRNDTSGISAAERELHTELVIEEVLRNTLAEGNKRKRIMGQGATTCLRGSDNDISAEELRADCSNCCDNDYNSNKSDGNRVKRNDNRSVDGMQQVTNTGKGCNAEVLHKVANDVDHLEGVVGNALSSSTSSSETQQNFLDSKRSERDKKNESTRRTMEELMKDKNFAPVEIIVADAISKDPLGFVHSLRDAKLLKSLEKLAYSRKLNSVVPNEQLEQLRKQRKKEKKREKKEKKKQKRLMKLAASFGVSVEQLELDMLAENNNCNNYSSSSPQSQSQSPFDYSNSFHHYSHSTTPSVVPSSKSSSVRRSIESTSHLSNLPAPSVINYSYLNVFPRPSFVPDPLDPSRNLVTDCHDSSSSASHQLQVADSSYLNPLIMSSSATVPSTSLPPPSLMHHQQQQQPSSESDSIVTLEEQHLNSNDGDTNNANHHLPIGILHQNNISQNDDCATKVIKPNDFANYNTGGNAPEDEEDEQNAIAISHLFPQFDALQQLKLIKMCTDNSVQEVDHQDVMNMIRSPESDSSNKVARTLALIKGKVKEFKQINRMHYTSDTEGSSIWNEDNGLTRLVRIDEDVDVDVSGNHALQVHLNGNSSSVNGICVNGKKLSNDASSNVFEPLEIPVTMSSSNAYPSTSHSVHNNGTNDCMGKLGMAAVGGDVQARTLNDPLSLARLDEHPVHRTPAVILTEVPIHEDDDNIYVSEMKVLTDWFNHAPYGAGKEAHMQYWDDVKQRVDVADWIRKLNTHRYNHLLSILSRKQARTSRGDMVSNGKRRSKSTEPWWPRKLFDHYEGVLDIAGKAMRMVASSFESNNFSQDEIPRVNNIPMKLDGDEAAAVAYFRPSSPATVCDPNDDYQNDVIARELRHTTTIDAGVFSQIELGDDDSQTNYLRWKKVLRMSNMKKSTKVINDSSRCSTGNSMKRCTSNGVRLACEASLTDMHSSTADSKKDDDDDTASNFDYSHEVLMDATTNHHHLKPSSNMSTSEFLRNNSSTIESGYCSSAISSNSLPPCSANSNTPQIPSTFDSFSPQPQHVLVINQSIADIANENGTRNGTLQLPPLSTVFDASSSDQHPLSKNDPHQQLPSRYESQLQSQSVVNNLCSSAAPKSIDIGNYNHQSASISSSTLHLHSEANGSFDMSYHPFEHIINQANFKVHSLSKTTLDDRAEANFFDTLFEEDETKMADAGGDPFLRMDHLI